MSRASTALFAVILPAMLFAAAAWAHDFPVERSLLAQVSRDRVQMMLVYQEPPGPRTDLLMAKFDLDNDAEIRGPELTLAEGELTRRAFHGLELEFIGERAGMHMPEMKVKRTKDGGLAAAFYLEYELEPQIRERTFAVRLQGAAERVVPLSLIVEAGDGMAIAESSSPVDRHATRPVELTAPVEHRTRFVVESTKGPAESPAGRQADGAK